MKKAGLFQIIGLSLLLVASAGTARAQDPLCDATLFTQMSQRALLLGQIETSVMENLVYKPDSVLEYTCFNRFMGVSVNNMSYYMTPYYITDVIQVGVTNYLYANFGHTYMGDRLIAGPVGTPPPTGTYVCDAMTYVWEGAKCLNFAQTEPQDSIYGLDGFAGATDIRAFIGTCTAPMPPVYGDLPVIGTFVATALPPAATDCGQPFPTGLVINQPVASGDSRPAQYNEKICPNPSCNYTPTGMDSGTCAP